MSRLDTGTTERLQDSFMITMGERTAARHEAAISEALLSVDVRAQRAPARWRLRIPALVAAAMVVAPVGAAVAADNANPGDVLYPVKRIVEPFVSIFDSDVVASHRVEELAHIVDQPDEADRLPAALADARGSVSDLPPDHALRNELDVITDRVLDHRIVDVAPTDVTGDQVTPHDQEPSDGEPEVGIPTDERPSDSTSTTTPEPDLADHTTSTQGAEQRQPSNDAPTAEPRIAHIGGDDHPQHDQEPDVDRTRDQG